MVRFLLERTEASCLPIFYPRTNHLSSAQTLCSSPKYAFLDKLHSLLQGQCRH